MMGHLWSLDLKALESLSLEIYTNLLEMWDWALEGREINTKNVHPEVIWIKHIMETIEVCSVAWKSFGEYKGENHELNLGNTCIWRHIKKRGYQEGKDDEVRIKQMQMLSLGALQERWISRSNKVTRASQRMRKIIKGTLNSATIYPNSTNKYFWAFVSYLVTGICRCSRKQGWYSLIPLEIQAFLRKQFHYSAGS